MGPSRLWSVKIYVPVLCAYWICLVSNACSFNFQLILMYIAQIKECGSMSHKLQGNIYSRYNSSRPAWRKEIQSIQYGQTRNKFVLRNCLPHTNYQSYVLTFMPRVPMDFTYSIRISMQTVSKVLLSTHILLSWTLTPASLSQHFCSELCIFAMSSRSAKTSLVPLSRAFAQLVTMSRLSTVSHKSTMKLDHGRHHTTFFVLRLVFIKPHNGG